MTPKPNNRISVLHDRAQRSSPGGAFASLTWQQQRVAEAWRWKFYQRWEGKLTPWRRAILTAVAKRLALDPPGPEWGRRMLAVQGGNAAYRRHCRVGVDVMAFARARKVCNKLKTVQKYPVRHLDL